ncbi:MAG: LCP family protein [Anaerolineales bacterium]|nr:LCP family protein [Anaerolineales bacterium]
MKTGAWIIIAVGIVLILILVVVIVMFVPLGPEISVSRPTETMASTPIVATPALPATPTLLAPVVARDCGSGTMLIMFLGESQPPRGADAIRLVRVDFDQNRIDGLSLPSELWVATPGLSARGVSVATLNQVYVYGRNQATGDERTRTAAAVSLLANTLQANYSYMPEHYFVIRQAAFAEFVDALNGVDVVLPVAVDGRAEGLGYFPAGAQHLNGAMALNLVRISGPEGWEHFDRQEMVIEAVYSSAMTPQNWDRIPALIDAFYGNVLTDLSVNQILDISCVLHQPGVVVTQQQVGPELVIYSGENMFSRSELRQYILQTVGK